MNLPEEKQPLASEIIEEIKKKVEILADKLEDRMCVVLDSALKAEHILDLSIAEHNLIYTGVPTQADLESFYGQKEKMLTEYWIVSDYLNKIKEETDRIDELTKELGRVQGE